MFRLIQRVSCVQRVSTRAYRQYVELFALIGGPLAVGVAVGAKWWTDRSRDRRETRKRWVDELEEYARELQSGHIDRTTWGRMPCVTRLETHLKPATVKLLKALPTISPPGLLQGRVLQEEVARLRKKWKLV